MPTARLAAPGLCASLARDRPADVDRCRGPWLRDGRRRLRNMVSAPQEGPVEEAADASVEVDAET